MELTLPPERQGGSDSDHLGEIANGAFRSVNLGQHKMMGGVLGIIFGRRPCRLFEFIYSSSLHGCSCCTSIRTTFRQAGADGGIVESPISGGPQSGRPVGDLIGQVRIDTDVSQSGKHERNLSSKFRQEIILRDVFGGRCPRAPVAILAVIVLGDREAGDFSEPGRYIIRRELGTCGRRGSGPEGLKSGIHQADRIRAEGVFKERIIFRLDSSSASAEQICPGVQ